MGLESENAGVTVQEIRNIMDGKVLHGQKVNEMIGVLGRDCAL